MDRAGLYVQLTPYVRCLQLLKEFNYQQHLYSGDSVLQVTSLCGFFQIVQLLYWIITITKLWIKPILQLFECPHGYNHGQCRNFSLFLYIIVMRISEILRDQWIKPIFQFPVPSWIKPWTGCSLSSD